MTLLETWPYTGRAEQLRTADALLDQPGPLSLLVRGHGGVGKSRFLAEVAGRAAERGIALRHVVGTRIGRTVRLGALAHLLPAPWHGASPRPGPAGIAAAILEANPESIFTIDDAHLLDPASATVIEAIVDSGQARIVAASDHAAALPPTDRRSALIELEPLSHHETRQLLHAVLGPSLDDATEATIWRMTRGNALYLKHLVDSSVAEGLLHRGPDQVWRWKDPTVTTSRSLSDLWAMELNASDPHPGPLMRLLAATGPLPADCVARLVGEEVVCHVRRRGWVHETVDGLAIVHGLHCDIAGSSNTPRDAQRLRGQAAKALLQAASGADPIRLATLWSESDLDPDPEILLAGSAAADRQLDTTTAERLARAAVAAGGGHRARLRHARALKLLGSGAEVDTALDAVGTDVSASDGRSDATILRASNLLWQLRDPAGAHRLIAAEAAAATPDRRRRLAVFTALQAALAGTPTRALTILSDTDRSGLTRLGTLSTYHIETLAAADLGDIGRLRRQFSLARATIDITGREVFHLIAMSDTVCLGLAAAGLLAESTEVAEHCGRLTAAVPGDARSVSVAIGAVAQLHAGAIGDAIANLDPAHLDFGPWGHSSGMAYRYRIFFTRAVAIAGDTGRAESELERTVASYHPAWGQLDSDLALTRAWVAAARGRITEAGRAAREGAELARERDQYAREVLCRQTSLHFWDTDVGDRLDELDQLTDGPRAGLVDRYARALSGRDASALLAVSHGFEQIGDRLAAIVTSTQCAFLHRLDGNHGSAMSCRERAAALAAPAGIDAGPPIFGVWLDLPLTIRESEVVMLSAGGATDREIAAALGISVRTVRGHIDRACTRTRVHDRDELAVLLRRHSGTPRHRPE